MFWKEKPGARRTHNKRAFKQELLGWARATGFSNLDPLQKKYRRKR